MSVDPNEFLYFSLQVSFLLEAASKTASNGLRCYNAWIVVSEYATQ